MLLQVIGLYQYALPFMVILLAVYSFDCAFNSVRRVSVVIVFGCIYAPIRTSIQIYLFHMMKGPLY